MSTRLQEHYKNTVVANLMKQFGYKSVMEVPRIIKITLNMGLGEAVNDKKVIEHAVGDLTKVAGQKPVVTKARKAIAGFKIRQGYPIGTMVTLRGTRMYEFLDRFITIDALRGLNISITTTAKSDEEAKALLAAFKFPFRN